MKLGTNERPPGVRMPTTTCITRTAVLYGLDGLGGTRDRDLSDRDSPVTRCRRRSAGAPLRL